MKKIYLLLLLFVGLAASVSAAVNPSNPTEDQGAAMFAPEIATSSMVTFQVDMSEYIGTFTSVGVYGTFNNWCGACTTMDDANMDGVYEVTVTVPDGNIEYLFIVDATTAEAMGTGSPCTITTLTFTNRIANITSDVTLPKVCWEECVTCLAQVDLPISFDDANVDYSTIGFGGPIATVTADPMSTTNHVLMIDKNMNSQFWGGVTLSTNDGLATAIPFSATQNGMNVDVYSQHPGTVVRLKAEDHTDPTKSVETEMSTTMSNAWETLTFDFSNQVPMTAAINYSYTYDKLSIFMGFGEGQGGAIMTTDKTYYIDDVEMAAPIVTMASVTFQVDMSEYISTYNSVGVYGSFNNWCGACTTMDDANMDGVYEVTVSMTNGPIEYLFIVDGASAEAMPTGSACTKTTGAFTNRAATIKGNTVLPEVCWQECVSCLLQVDLPINFDDANVDYSTIGFGGPIGTVTADPLSTANHVLMIDKNMNSQFWGGVTLSTNDGLATAIPFNATRNAMTVDVYSQHPGTVVRLKAEDHTDPTKSVETEMSTTMSNAWETLTFDFSNQVPMTAAINYSNTYDKLSIFMGFGEGQGGAIMTTDKTYYIDDVEMAAPIATMASVTFQVDMSEYISTYNSVGVYGSFNNWCGACTTMDDANMDGVYEVTVSMTDGTIEYLFIVDGVSAEAMPTGSACTKTTGAFTNRLAMIKGNTVLPEVCWQECVSCLAQIDLPISFDDANVDYSTIGFGGPIATVTADPMSTTNHVLMIDKNMNSQFWGGVTLSTNDGLATAIPFSATQNGMNVNVYSQHPGTVVRLKAEDHTDPTKSVETEMSTTMSNAWETLTFDFSNQVPMTAAINYSYTYDKLSIFMGFGEGQGGAIMTTDKTYYIDDVEMAGPLSTSSMVTFQVDMANYIGTYTSVGVLGAFNNWCGACTTMDDANMDGIYDVTVQVANGSMEYLFILDGNMSEAMASGSSCTKTTGMFTNREAIINSNVTLPPVCWEDCNTCSPVPTGNQVTFSVDMNDYTGPAFTTVFVNGDFNGFCGGCAPMSDGNNDGIWDITVSLPMSVTSMEYKFTLDTFAVEERFVRDQSCTKTTGNFTNRYAVISGDTMLPVVCFNSCSSCNGIPNSSNVTFRVDMAEYMGAGFSTVNLNGKFNAWCGGCINMDDSNMDTIYEFTVYVPRDTLEFKFSLDGWTAQEMFSPTDPCTKTVGSFTNRVLVNVGDTILPAFCWNECTACGSVGIEHEHGIERFEIIPNIGEGLFRVDVQLNEADVVKLQIYDINGREIRSMSRRVNFLSEMIDLGTEAEGMYQVRLSTSKGLLSKKLIIVR